MARPKKVYPPRQCVGCGVWQEMGDRNALDPDPCLGRIEEGVTYACCGHDDPNDDPYVTWSAGGVRGPHPTLRGQAALDWFASRGLNAPRVCHPEAQARAERTMAKYPF